MSQRFATVKSMDYSFKTCKTKEGAGKYFGVGEELRGVFWKGRYHISYLQKPRASRSAPSSPKRASKRPP